MLGRRLAAKGWKEIGTTWPHPLRTHRIAAVADKQQVALIKQGPLAWNDWRRRDLTSDVDLNGADLTGADLYRADLSRADLSGAQLADVILADANLTIAKLVDAKLTNASLLSADLLVADLTGADLTNASLAHSRLTNANLTRGVLAGADLSGADLTRADLSHANLTRANLSGAHLRNTNLIGADLTGANLTDASFSGAYLARADLTGAHCDHTVLADLSLGETIGLESVIHAGPSSLDSWTLLFSGDLPLTFLRGCGLPEDLIAFLPSLLHGRTEFYSCFISYSTANQSFADRLHADLQARGVRCWFAPHDIQGGKRIHDQIDQAIRTYDRLLVILSRESMSSGWVEEEIESARQKELHSQSNVLFPIAIVPYAEVRDWKSFNADRGDNIARKVREYFIPDFSDWQTNHGKYQAAFEKLLAALKSNTADGADGD